MVYELNPSKRKRECSWIPEQTSVESGLSHVASAGKATVLLCLVGSCRLPEWWGLWASAPWSLFGVIGGSYRNQMGQLPACLPP